jgi:hypothetical protein
MMSGALGWKDRLWSSLQAAWLSSRLLGVNVSGARDDFWATSAFLYFTWLLSHPTWGLIRMGYPAAYVVL